MINIKQVLSAAMICAATISASPALAQWSAGSSGTVQDLNTIWRIDANRIIAGGTGGTLLLSTDGGSSFAPAFAPGVDDVNEIQFIDASTGYAVADNGRFMSTADGGSTWTTSFLATGSNLTGLHFRDAMNGHVVGRDGVIFATSNGGSTWTAQTSGTTERLEDVYFFDASKGYVAGRNDTWLSTTDGGSNWSVSTLLGTGRDLNDLFFTDAMNGYIASDNGVVLRSTDGGASWTSSFTGTIQNLNEVYFLDANTGYMAGDAGTVLRTDNAGATWIAEVSGTTANLEDIHFAADGSGAAAGAMGTVIVQGAADPCGTAVTGLTSTVGFTAVALDWQDVSTATAYQIEGAEVGGLARRRIVSSSAISIGAGFFTPGLTYEWRVRAQCADGNVSPWSAYDSFTVPLLRKTTTSEAPAVYPNPASEWVQLSLPSEASYSISDLTGRILIAGAGNGDQRIDISGLEAGLYLVSIHGTEGDYSNLLTVH